jgi:UTP-glucose-1-phosphate uridylyltransferase
MIKPVRPAIFPVAGLGTRFPPVTKANIAFAPSRPDIRDVVAPALRAMLGGAAAEE